MADDLVHDAREMFDESAERTNRIRERAREDVRFARHSDQWPDDIKDARSQEGRPCLTINRLPAFIRQVVNDGRQNRAGIMVKPVDSGADEKTAHVLAGLIRSIEQQSQADVAYDTALDHAVTASFGFWQVVIDWAHPQSFDKECYIRRIADPLSVYWDHATTQFDASDWSFGFVIEDVAERDFKERYPDAALVSVDDDRAYNQSWRIGDDVRIAEYYRRTVKTGKLLLLSNGMEIRTLPEKEYKGEARASLDVLGFEVIREREAEFPEVMRHVISGVEELEKPELWPGTMIPIVPVWGDEIWGENGREFKSMTRDAADAQRMFNYWRTASTELIALAPKAPFIGPEGFTAGHEADWRDANTRTLSTLEYAGDVPPIRQPFAGIPAGIMQESLAAADDIKAVVGIHDAALGVAGNETSGRAIFARQREADVSNFHFLDNQARAIGYTGRVLLEVIPSVYSARQTVRILGEDMAESVINLVTENQPAVPGKFYDLNVGKYDVTVRQGPSFTTQREETRDTLIELAERVPDAAAILGDVLVDHLDFVGSDKLARRLRALLPPEIRQMEDAEGLDELPDEAKAIMVSAQQTIAQLQAALQAATAAADEQQAKIAETQAEAATAQAQAQAEAIEAGLKHQREVEEARAEAVLKGRELTIRENEVAIKRAEAEARVLDMNTAAGERGATEAAMQGAAQSMQALAAVMAEEAVKAEGRHQQMLAALMAPKAITLNRDREGNIEGAESSVRAFDA